jgi:hypothetical protein
MRGQTSTRWKCLRFAVSRQGRMARCARAQERRGLKILESGGPHAGCAVRKVGVVCMSRLKRRHARGGAVRARPELRRMVSASDRQWRAASCRPDTGSRKRRVASSGTGRALRWRSGDARAQNALPASARRPATGPFPAPPRLPAGAGRHKGQEFVRWLAWPDARKDAKTASGTRRCTCLLPRPAARYGRHPEAFLPPGPTRFRVHPVTGADAGSLECCGWGKDWGRILTRC